MKSVDSLENTSKNSNKLKYVEEIAKLLDAFDLPN
jgi:hypothetical protein